MTNDDLRRNLLQHPGHVFMTAGLAAQGDEFVREAVQAVQEFEDFDQDNDPYGERDLVVTDVQGKRIMAKIDCYEDSTMQYGADPESETAFRVITLMLAEEY